MRRSATREELGVELMEPAEVASVSNEPWVSSEGVPGISCRKVFKKSSEKSQDTLCE